MQIILESIDKVYILHNLVLMFLDYPSSSVASFVFDAVLCFLSSFLHSSIFSFSFGLSEEQILGLLNLVAAEFPSVVTHL